MLVLARLNCQLGVVSGLWITLRWTVQWSGEEGKERC